MHTATTLHSRFFININNHYAILYIQHIQFDNIYSLCVPVHRQTLVLTNSHRISSYSTGLSFPHTHLPLIHIATQHRPVLPPYAHATHSYCYTAPACPSPYAAATHSYNYTATACPSPIRTCHSFILLHSTGLSFPHTRLPLTHITI